MVQVTLVFLVAMKVEPDGRAWFGVSHRVSNLCRCCVFCRICFVDGYVSVHVHVSGVQFDGVGYTYCEGKLVMMYDCGILMSVLTSLQCGYDLHMCGYYGLKFSVAHGKQICR